MADLVLAIGMSHSPMVVAEDIRLWLAFGAADRNSPHLVDAAGEHISFAELENVQGRRYARCAAPERLREQLTSTRSALWRLQAELRAARADVVVVIGDDQTELFDASNTPALAIYCGERFVMATRTGFRDRELDRRAGLERDAYTRGVGMDAPHVWPGHAALAEHLIGFLVEQRFDVTALKQTPWKTDGVGLGHAFGVVETQLIGEQRRIPLVPVFINCYWPPNQVTPARCCAFGRALRRAIDDYPEDLRVAVVASGGLSHFVVDVQLDEQVLEMLIDRDIDGLTSLPSRRLQSGNSEIRNWIAVAGAVEDKAMALHAYIPVRRTAVGTGCGLAFASWA